MIFGCEFHGIRNKIVDDGNYLFTDVEKNIFLKAEPKSEKFFKPILSGDEFINGENRWVLYLADADPHEIRQLPSVMERVKEVAKFRSESKKPATKKSAKTPLLFSEPRQPKSDFLLIPRTSSENRLYLPLAFFKKEIIVNDSCTALPNASLYDFAMLSSTMHMTWVKYVCGRLESRLRYSNTIAYNNYPFPKDVSEKKKESIEIAAQAILDVRKKYMDTGSSLADLYGISNQQDLLKAHENLDKLIDKCYREEPFISETKRIEFLFELYEKYTADLFTKNKKKKK